MQITNAAAFTPLLNLVICHACKTQSVRNNLMDSCQELFSFLHNSPKCQKFLEVATECLSPDTKKRRLKYLCKTRWIKRHTTCTFETIFDLYEYIIVALSEIRQTTNNDRFYSDDDED